MRNVPVKSKTDTRDGCLQERCHVEDTHREEEKENLLTWKGGDVNF